MDKKIAISVRNVTKKFKIFASPLDRIREALHPLRRQFHKEFWALKGVNFEVHKGEVVGILGKNGSGKSTLLQIICSVMQPTTGQAETHGRIAALLELGAGFNPEFSGRENVLLNGAIMGISRKEMLRRMPEIEAFADVGQFFDLPVKTYSSGMFVRVAFSVAIHVDPEILLVDEALSVGDSQFQHRCYQKIRSLMREGRTILVVSHSTDTLLRICDRGVLLDSGAILFCGDIEGAVGRYHELLFSKEKIRLSQQDNRSIIEDVTVFDDSSEDKASRKALYNPYETRIGNGGVRIIDFDLVVDGVSNPIDIDSHGQAHLFVKILFEQDLSDVCLGFATLSVDGLYVFGANETAQTINGSAGEIRLVAVEWRPHLVGGNYFLSVGCYLNTDSEVKFLDIRRSFIKVHVKQTPSDIGFAELEAKWMTDENDVSSLLRIRQ